MDGQWKPEENQHQGAGGECRSHGVFREVERKLMVKGVGGFKVAAVVTSGTCSRDIQQV